MKTYLDCIPCFFRQALEAAKLAAAGPRARRQVVNELGRTLPEFSLRSTPPEMGGIIYRLVRRITGVEDPYRGLKRQSNRKALALYPRLVRKIERSRDPLSAAVRLAIAGNIIDYGIKNTLNVERELRKMLRSEDGTIRTESKRLYQFERFRNAVRRAKTVLYLADNAGETVFDRLLIETVFRENPEKKFFYAVKAEPTINDALEEDARVCGIGKLARIVSSGLSAPGTVLQQCNREFRRIFRITDMVISKGQGNFESLSPASRRVFFLFMAKCPVVAAHVGCRLGEIILKQGGKT